jgi:hypothetical protein
MNKWREIAQVLSIIIPANDSSLPEVSCDGNAISSRLAKKRRFSQLNLILHCTAGRFTPAQSPCLPGAGSTTYRAQRLQRPHQIAPWCLQMTARRLYPTR